MLARKLTPLIYVNEHGPLAEMIKAKYGRSLMSFSDMVESPDGKKHFVPTVLNITAFEGLREFLPYRKSSLGHTLQRRPHPPVGKSHETSPDYEYQWCTKYLEEEFEWRYVPDSHRDQIFGLADYAKWGMAEVSKLSEATKGSFLEFNRNEVETIIVNDEDQRRELVGSYPDLEGKVRIWTELLLEPPDKPISCESSP